MDSAHEPEHPVLEIDAGDPFWSKHSALSLCWKDPVFGLFALSMLGTKVLPVAIWGSFAFPAMGLGRLAPVGAFFLGLPFLFLVFPGIWLAEFLVFRRYVTARSGHVAFFKDRVSFSKEAGRADVAFSELACFSDDSSDYVQLLRKGDRWGKPVLAVPTPEEKERVAVLALLDEKKVPRRGAGYEH